MLDYQERRRNNMTTEIEIGIHDVSKLEVEKSDKRFLGENPYYVTRIHIIKADGHETDITLFSDSPLKK